MMTAIAAGARSGARRFAPLALIAVLMAAAHLLDALLLGALSQRHGLAPRRIDGLDGILAMPLLHDSWSHLLANLAPLLILGALILIVAPRRFWAATLLSVVLSGALIWLLARPYNHIGASALVFAWFGFLATLGVLERSWRAGLGALAAILLFGAEILFGLRPSDPGVSWDGHLAGLVAGAASAWALRRRRAPRRQAARRR